jgi:aspartyl-tRNA synthetase
MAQSPCQIEHKLLREVYVQSTYKYPKLAGAAAADAKA